MNPKEIVTEKLKEAFGSSFLGIQDKKIYVQVNDAQVAITLTVPKVNYEVLKEVKVEKEETTIAFTPAERSTIEELLAKL